MCGLDCTSLGHSNIMKRITVSYRHTLFYILLALVSTLAVSCGTVRSIDYSEMPTNRHMTPEDVWGSGKKHGRESRDKGTVYQQGDNSIEKWKKLDIKLGRHDNHMLYREIKSWLGTPHKDGAHKKHEGTDCSGFVMEIYYTVYNIKIERNSARIFTHSCYEISPEELREGDLVFFHNGSGNRITHVGIYLKDNMFAHASSSRGVVIDDLTSRYYSERFYAAGRVK